jgi:hypothetical protein
MPRIDAYYDTEYELLCQAVIASMLLSFDLFGIRTRITCQSDMQYDRSLQRGELVRALARAAGADCYLSGVGAQAYLDESAFKDSMSIRYNHFKHPRYSQKGSVEFHSDLSCLDALFNLGIDGARKLLRGAPQ